MDVVESGNVYFDRVADVLESLDEDDILSEDKIEEILNTEYIKGDDEILESYFREGSSSLDDLLTETDVEDGNFVSNIPDSVGSDTVAVSSDDGILDISADKVVLSRPRALSFNSVDVGTMGDTMDRTPLWETEEIDSDTPFSIQDYSSVGDLPGGTTNSPLGNTLCIRSTSPSSAGMNDTFTTTAISERIDISMLEDFRVLGYSNISDGIPVEDYEDGKEVLFRTYLTLVGENADLAFGDTSDPYDGGSGANYMEISIDGGSSNSDSFESVSKDNQGAGQFKWEIRYIAENDIYTGRLWRAGSSMPSTTDMSSNGVPLGDWFRVKITNVVAAEEGIEVQSNRFISDLEVRERTG